MGDRYNDGVRDVLAVIDKRMDKVMTPKEKECCCEGKYPNLKHHSKERCFTEVTVDETAI